MNRVLNFATIAVLSVVFLCGEVAADTATVGGYTWTYRINGGEAEIYGTNGGSPSPAISPKPTGAVTIPSTLGGKPVTSLGVNTLFYCEGLTSVTIPDSVKSIGFQAFYRCKNLKNITIPSGVTNISSYAFDFCDGLWTKWYWSLADGRSYNLTQTAGDRAIASVMVSADSSIDSFVLKDGKVYDSVLYINNTADHTVTLTLPSGYVYKAIKGATPLRIPANTQCILSITRVAEQVFIVSREDLETIQ